MLIGTLFYANRRRVDFAADKVQRDRSLVRRWNVLCPEVEGETRGGEAAIRIPRGSKAAPCMLQTSPRLALNNYRAILFILMSCIARAFRHSVSSINVMSRLYGPLSRRPTWCSSTRSGLGPVLLLRVLRAKPGEHSFAEEAKVANYRVASREGGLMRSPMTGHIRPPFCSCRWTMPGDDSTLASKSTDRCVNPTTDAFVSVSHLLVSTRLSVLNLSLSFLLSPSTGSSSTPFFFSPGYHRSSLTVRTVPDLVRSEERSDPGDRRVVTVIPQKDSDARLLSSMRLSSSRSFPRFSSSLLLFPFASSSH